MNAHRQFKISIVVALGINVILQSIEYISGQYLYVLTASDGIDLDERLFGGQEDIFRAKGLFPGPLSAVAFGLGVALVHGRSPIVLALYVCTSVFAAGRLGLILSGVLFLHSLIFNPAPIRTSVSLKKGWLRSKHVLVGLVGFLILLSIWVSATSEGKLFDRVSEGISLENSQNLARLEIWSAAITELLRYDPLFIIAGRSGEFRSVFGYGAESDWLLLALDSGLIGLMVYFYWFVYLVSRALRRDQYCLLLLGVALAASVVSPQFSSLMANVLLWVFFYATIERLRVT